MYDLIKKTVNALHIIFNMEYDIITINKIFKFCSIQSLFVTVELQAQWTDREKNRTHTLQLYSKGPKKMVRLEIEIKLQSIKTIKQQQHLRKLQQKV